MNMDSVMTTTGEAYAEGRAAGNSGADLAKNPYKQEMAKLKLAIAWAQGWHSSATKEAQGQTPLRLEDIA